MMTMMPPFNWRTDHFDFVLPQDRIAQQAIEPRDHARLLHVKSGSLSDHHVYNLPDLLQAGDLLVINNTKVIPARLYGQRGTMRVEILLHRKTGPQCWLAFARPGKRLRVNDRVEFAEDFAATILEKHDHGQILIRIDADDERILELLHKYGEPPLPPYIRRSIGEARQDQERYQTVYAERHGAVAAPTAGLHFTPDLLQRLSARNIQHVTVTLHVGAGTFLPVKVDHIKDHVMHSEWGEITANVAAQINTARQMGRRIVSVGTTSLRVLESAADEAGNIRPFAEDTAIFITPGYRFRAVDALMTNFHLPKSTLFMLVSAFAGLEPMRRAYEYAIQKNYRFYSYGDATLLERQAE